MWKIRISEKLWFSVACPCYRCISLVLMQAPMNILKIQSITYDFLKCWATFKICRLLRNSIAFSTQQDKMAWFTQTHSFSRRDLDVRLLKDIHKPCEKVVKYLKSLLHACLSCGQHFRLSVIKGNWYLDGVGLKESGQISWKRLFWSPWKALRHLNRLWNKEVWWIDREPREETEGRPEGPGGLKTARVGPP